VFWKLNSTGDLLSGQGKYENEYVWLFHLETDMGESNKPKIEVAKEFFDSLYSAQVLGMLDRKA